jgi:hypothetical protein
MLPRVYDKGRSISRGLLRGIFLSLLAIQSVYGVAQHTSNTEELTREATFIFKGTVQKSGASNMAPVKANSQTAIVRVDEVIYAPGAPPDLQGKQITVQLLESPAVKPGFQAVFFTKGWLLGQSMAVIELGRMEQTTGSTQSIRSQVNETHQRMADEELQVEIAASEAVIVAEVVSVRPSQIPHLGSEHDPDWYEARLAVQSVIKGNLHTREVTLLFPHSEDVMWHRSPKFKEGQNGIFLLHRNQARLPGIENQFTALNPSDFHSTEDLSRIQRLSRTQQ